MQAAAWYRLASRRDDDRVAAEREHEVGRHLVAGDDEVTAGAQAHRSDDRIRQGDKRMEEATRLVRSQHVEAECNRSSAPRRSTAPGRLPRRRLQPLGRER